MERTLRQITDLVGMWAIGSGAHAALSSLAFDATHHQLTSYSGLTKTLYCVCAAKFMAESSPNVGKDTFVAVHEQGKPVRFVSGLGVERVKKKWMKHGAPQMSAKIMNELPSLLYDLETPVNKEEAEKRFDAMVGSPGYIKRAIAQTTKKANKAMKRLASQTSTDQQ